MKHVKRNIICQNFFVGFKKVKVYEKEEVKVYEKREKEHHHKLEFFWGFKNKKTAFTYKSKRAFNYFVLLKYTCSCIV